MDLRLIARYTGILLLVGLIFRFGWMGQTLLLQRPPDIRYGLTFFGLAIVLMLLMLRWVKQQQKPSASLSLSAIPRLYSYRTLGIILLLIGIGGGATTYWLHTQKDVLVWTMLASWIGSIVVFLLGAWSIDQHSADAPEQPNPSSPSDSSCLPAPPAPAPINGEGEPPPPCSRIKGEGQGNGGNNLAQPYPAWEILLIFTITLVGFFLRQVFLAEVPHNLSGDEGEMGLAARKILHGIMPDPFATGWLSHPNLWFFLQAFSLWLFGNDVAGLRMLSVLFGTATIPALYLFARPFFGRAAALFGAALLASNHFHIHYSRNALNNIADPLLGVLGFAALLRGIHSRKLLPFALAGVAFGVAQHFYMGARLLPLLVVLLLCYEVIIHPMRFVRVRWHWGLVAIGFLLGIGPLLWFFLSHPSDFNARLELVGVYQSDWLRSQIEFHGLTIQQVWQNQIIGGFGAYTFMPDRSAQYDPGIALLDPYTSILFVLGIALLIMRWRRGESVLLLAWLIGTSTLGGVLLANAPVSPRYVTTAPIFCLVAAVALAELAKLLPQLLPMSRWVVHGVAGAVVVVLAVWNINFYFNDYTPRNIFGWINVEVGTELGYYLANQPDSEEVYVYFFGPPRMYYGFGTTKFLSRDVDGEDIHDPLVVPEQLSPLPYGKRPIFVFLPEREGELEVVRQRYPEGDLYRIPRYTHRDDILFVSYEPDMEK